MEKKLEAGLVPQSERQVTIQRLFEQTGCKPQVQTISKHSGNVVCVLEGETDRTIVVGAHLDFVPNGKGIVDDWSGAALLPSLYSSLKSERRHHTFKFVAFDEEEKGLVGSTKYVRSETKEELGRVVAFVNIECLGLGSPNVWVHRSNALLVARLADIAKTISVPLKGVDVDKIGDDDTHPFLAKKVPVISIHSVSQETLSVLHSQKDDLTIIDRDNYYASYKLLAFYLAYLDALPIE